MKTKLFVAVLALSGCGQAAPTSTVNDSPSTALSLCETFAKSEDLAAFKVVKPAEEALSPMEKAMIQAAVLSTDLTPVTPEQALDIFTDKDNGGSLGGDITYFKIQHNGREKLLANATYYPGDNEYGALFEVWTFDDGTQSAGMIGEIGDSDVYCSRFVE